MGKINIDRIQVEGLFGCFNYDLKLNNPKASDLVLFYGDNGSGKTTVLKLIFYLLSHRDGEGHKSAVARIKFKKFSVHLSNAVIISAYRKKSTLGSFVYTIKGKDIRYSVALPSDDKNNYKIFLSEGSSLQNTFSKMLNYLKELNIKMLFLSDTRTILNTERLGNVRHPISRGNKANSQNVHVEFSDDEQIDEFDLLKTTLKRLEDMFRSEAIKASNAGEIKTNDIYYNIIKQITKAKQKESELSDTKLLELERVFEDVAARTQEYSIYGLVSETEYTKLKDALSISQKSKQEVIFNILEPFIKGLQVKLDAYRTIHDAVSNLIAKLNSFLSYKEVTYNIQTGFHVHQKMINEVIDFAKLSSGEKQLILLFCSAILANSKATFFIIDEPEISLNIKWQREILSNLLSLNPNNIQYLIATHSIEVISNQRENVVRLKNRG